MSNIASDQALESRNLATGDAFATTRVWTRYRNRGIAIVRQRDCGCAVVNELVMSDQRASFCGSMMSGYGRELSHQSIRQYEDHFGLMSSS